ncbi:CC/Se motif family (seleno)protein [Azoarcus taiwanensis]|uniref:Uncharacterized protein n=1 Tax=Azoarcus taiwanensis TaxID=666964 RepID=A0A972FFJ4_9RHOO|nr:CC/Se motif family (seleno)protein [Azoarcus taiwanensis]NMG04412.1 hypothetical protein [Azoarcus taiwanensis]
MTTIAITPAAQRWLMDQGGMLTLRTSIRNGCCGGRAAVPVAEARSPDEPLQYRSHHMDGLRVWVAAELEDEEMKVDIDGFGPWCRLCLEAGIRPAADVTTET